MSQIVKHFLHKYSEVGLFPRIYVKSQRWWCKLVSLAFDREGTRDSLASLSEQTSELQLMRDSVSRNMVEGT